MLSVVVPTISSKNSESFQIPSALSKTQRIPQEAED